MFTEQEQISEFEPKTGEPTHFKERFLSVARYLDSLDLVRWVVVGDLALGIYTQPRYTDRIETLRMPGGYNEFPLSHVVRSAHRVTLLGKHDVPVVRPKFLLWWLTQREGHSQDVADAVALLNSGHITDDDLKLLRHWGNQFCDPKGRYLLSKFEAAATRELYPNRHVQGISVETQDAGQNYFLERGGWPSRRLAERRLERDVLLAVRKQIRWIEDPQERHEAAGALREHHKAGDI